MYVDAQYELGTMYLHGKYGVVQDTKKGKELLEKAAADTAVGRGQREASHGRPSRGEKAAESAP